MEEFGEDLFSTPECRRDDFDRRNSLGGGSIFNAILAPVEPSNTYMISSVTIESYSQLVLRDITLDSWSFYEPVSKYQEETPGTVMDDS